MSAEIPDDAILEARLGEIWKACLNRPAVASNDNFFRIGGDSLAATMVLTRVREEFGVALPLRALFQHKTLHGVASAIQQALQDRATEAEFLRLADEEGMAG
jgi:acyl carrier protein